MRLIHLSDLHLGRRLKERSLLEDQEYILERILEIVDGEEPDAVLIAGDVYDKSVPSAEAVQLCDTFLVRLSEQRFGGKRLETFLISGNHDSPERLAFGGRLMEKSGVHISPVYGGNVEPVTLGDTYGLVRFYLMPFLKPAHVRRFWPDEKTETYTDALRTVISHMEIDPTVRNILLAHQFITGAERSDSEETSVGGLDNVDVSVFAPFDYVALGHLHGPQSVERETVRYCGSPLKYSFSEVRQRKSVTVVELGGKGSVSVRTVPLVPQHDMRRLRGTFRELTARDFYAGTALDDYIHVTLTDEDAVPDAMRRLQVIYPNLLGVDYDNRRTRAGGPSEAPEHMERLDPLELFSAFYEDQNNQPMSQEQRAYMAKLMEKIWEESR